MPSGVARRIVGWSDIVPVICAIGTEKPKIEKDKREKPGMNINVKTPEDPPVVPHRAVGTATVLLERDF